MSIKKTVFAFLIAMAFLNTVGLNAERSAADIEAAQIVGEMLTAWWDGMPATKPVSISILQLDASENLDTSFKSLVEEILLGAFAQSKNTQAINCLECHQPQIKVKNDRLIVTKGVPNQDSLKALAKKLELEGFVTVHLTKTAFSLKVFVMVQYAASGAVYATKEFSVSNVGFYDASMQFLIGTGLQWEFLLKDAKRTEHTPLAFEFSLLQSVGTHTRVGLNLGGLISPRTDNFMGLIHILPQIGWKLRLGRSAYALMPSLNAGLACRFAPELKIDFGDLKNSKADAHLDLGLMGGVSLDLMLGQFFYIGAKTSVLWTVAKKNNEFILYPGFHLGMVLGR